MMSISLTNLKLSLDGKIHDGFKIEAGLKDVAECGCRGGVGEVPLVSILPTSQSMSLDFSSLQEEGCTVPNKWIRKGEGGALLVCVTNTRFQPELVSTIIFTNVGGGI